MAAKAASAPWCAYLEIPSLEYPSLCLSVAKSTAAKARALAVMVRMHSKGWFRCAERRPAATSEAAARPAGLDALLLAALLSPCVDGNRAWRCVLLVSL